MALKHLRRLLATALLAITLGLAGPALVPAVTTVSAAGVTVQTDTGATVAQQLTNHAKQSWPWYVTRASGLVAAVLLVILLLSGIGQVTGMTYRVMEPITAWATHRAIGITFSVSMLAHVLALLFDRFIPFNIVQLLVPFASNYKTTTIFGVYVGSLWVALGIVALYLLAIIVVSSLLWIEKQPRTWRWLHFLSYLAMAFVFIHALYLGTDLAVGFWRAVWIGAGIVILVSIIHRLRRVGTI